MFTGIITFIGTVLFIQVHHDTASLKLHLPFFAEWSDLKLGESIAIEGVCLSLAEFVLEEEGVELVFDISPETFRITNLHYLVVGSRVNMERALRASDRLGGHYVSGHVDQIAFVTDLHQQHNFLSLRFAFIDRSGADQLIKKGSITVNGVSLTINDIFMETSAGGFEVMLIPQTLEKTTLSKLCKGARVNIEFDIFVKVINNQLARYSEKNL